MVAEQNLLLHIRQATKALHEQLDSCYPFITMQSSEINPNSYRTMLEILYLWHQKVSPHLSVSSEFLRLGETNFLCCRNDLESDLGYTISTSSHNQYSLPHASISYSIGVLYVFLGSANGACHILKTLKDKNANVPHLYFINQARRIPLWREYSTQIASYDLSQKIEQTAMQKGACDAFSLLLELTKVQTSIVTE